MPPIALTSGHRAANPRSTVGRPARKGRKSGKPPPNKRSNGHEAGGVILASGYSADELSFVSKGDSGSNNIGTPRKHKKPKRAGARR